MPVGHPELSGGADRLGAFLTVFEMRKQFRQSESLAKL